MFLMKGSQSWADVAVGILTAEEGAIAERWLRWEDLAFLEKATDHTLAEKLRDGLRIRKQNIFLENAGNAGLMASSQLRVKLVHTIQVEIMLLLWGDI
jgi:hypothetical protein